MNYILMLSITFGFASFVSADILDPKVEACTMMQITDDQAVQKLMNMLDTKAKVETIDDNGSKILITSKEMNLGASTNIRCTQLTEHGKKIGYFRGSRSGCWIVKEKISLNREKPSGTAK